MGPFLRLLIILAGVWLVVYFVRRALARWRHQAGEAAEPRRRGRAGGVRPRQITRMLRCQRCGTYVPESEAITSRGKTYCCEAHRREDLA
jgi:uncharacterized protein